VGMTHQWWERDGVGNGLLANTPYILWSQVGNGAGRLPSSHMGWW